MKSHAKIVAVLSCLIAIGSNNAVGAKKRSSKVDSEASRKADFQVMYARINQGVLNWGKRSQEKAMEQLLNEQCSYAEKRFGNHSAEYSYAERCLGVAYMDHHRAREGIPHLEKAFAIEKELAAKKAPSAVFGGADTVGQWLAKAYLRCGFAEKGRAMVLDEAIRLEKAGNYSQLMNRASWLMRFNSYDDAMKLMEKAQAMCKRQGKDMMPLLDEQITSTVRLRKYNDALLLYEKKRRLLIERGDNNKLADTIAQQAHINDLLEKQALAIKQYDEALRMMRTQKRDKFALMRLMDDYEKCLRRAGFEKKADDIYRENEKLSESSAK